MDAIIQLFQWCYQAWYFLWALMIGVIMLGCLIEFLRCLYESCRKGDWRMIWGILIFALGCWIGWENRDSYLQAPHQHPSHRVIKEVFGED
jgi:apolipoprotein N-acyltransferase